MSWIRDVVSPGSRRWEELYRRRHQHDRVVRSTHGVNCTGGCSWNVHVKEGIVGWETQARDYPAIDGVPPYEPRGCARGASFSWYLYSPLRVKYPYVRGVLADAWRAARAAHPDPVDAWAALVSDAGTRARWQRARGKGGLRRTTWEEALELVAASIVHTVKTRGPDRVVGFSPIPAMSMLSFAAGSRFLQLLGGVNLSFYDWYCDLPNASPQTWGEQTDVAETADWFHSKYIVAMGSNPDVTRTPSAHILSEARHDGAKLVVLSPDLSTTSKHADWWIPVHAGQDGAFWMAAVHVILRDFHAAGKAPAFLEYLSRYTDAPFLVRLEERDGALAPGRLLRASELARTSGVENAAFKYLVWDGRSGAPRMPLGSLGFRWQARQGEWNLQLKDGLDGEAIAPALTLLGAQDAVGEVAFDDFAGARTLRRGVPVKRVETASGPATVATIYDLLLAQLGVGRGLPGAYPEGDDDPDLPYTPAWQERFTGVDRRDVVRLAHEWAETAARTGGRCSILIGAGVNHWYHADLTYRAAITALLVTGCVGRNGGGLNHYVGQEKLAPVAPWATLAGALDWGRPPRFQNTPSFHYVHSDQWRYERASDERRLDPTPGGGPLVDGHTVDHQVRAVRRGWLPFFPQFDRNPLDVVAEARAAGARTDAEVVGATVEALRAGRLRLAVEDPDAPESWPRVFIVWRGNALSSSAKGQEYFLRHYLGTDDASIARETAKESVKEVAWRDEAPTGKLDLVVDLNFRMDTSALYSDLVLPAATWYEKDDLNTTDLHTFIHPLQAAVPPCWESRSDWDAFEALARKVAELSRRHLPEPVRDLVAVPIQHDTPGEMAEPELRDWRRGECAPVPGKTMFGLAVVERDYAHLHDRFTSFGPLARTGGIGAHGLAWPIDDVWDELAARGPSRSWGGKTYPSVATAVEAANLVLRLAPETNGEMAFRAYQAEERKVGVPLADLAEGARSVRMDFDDLGRQPRRILNSPCWTGIIGPGRTYTAYALNVERLVPWRTLTGRQHLYLDHPGLLAHGEALPAYKPRCDPSFLQDLVRTVSDGRSIRLNYLTPHGKWNIHSTYGDNLRMLTLSRGLHPLWLSEQDAARVEVEDGDWVEVTNDHGVVVTRAVVSARVPAGMAIQYHAPERTISVPRAPSRGGTRGGSHNSLSRVRLKPTLMLGGYGQLSYAFNYWGPTGNNRDTYVLVRKLEGEPRF
ncbi:MAG TPA: nitrate reductase subunit alpha [Anaeromyxobacter sp.]